MNIILASIVLLIVAFVIWFIVLGKISQSGNSPGLADGKLTQCPDKRNCVCSEYPQNSRHFIEPVKLETINDSTLSSVKTVLQKMGGTVVQQKENYLAATYSSNIFGFVDDLEIRIVPDEQLIHVRSGSRVGDGDLGVNRKRIEQFRELLTANQ